MGGDLVGEVSYKFSLTDAGRKRAREAMELCGYVGPAPVPLDDYVEQCYRQAVTGLRCTPESLIAPFSHLVLSEELFNNIGPAIVSGRSVFIYGPPGNGKTAIARSIGEFMNQSGGSVYVPHAFIADGNIVTVYDPSLHQADDAGIDDHIPTTATPPSNACSPPGPSIRAGCASSGLSSSPAANSTCRCSTFATTPRPSSTRRRSISRPTAACSSSTTSAASCAAPRSFSTAGFCRSKIATTSSPSPTARSSRSPSSSSSSSRPISTRRIWSTMRSSAVSATRSASWRRRATSTRRSSTATRASSG